MADAVSLKTLPVVSWLTGAVKDEMAEAIQRIDEISSEVCKATAKGRFDSARMVRDYLSLYQRILEGRPTLKKATSLA